MLRGMIRQAATLKIPNRFRILCALHGEHFVPCPACLGAKGGSSRSPAKTAAARRNARKPRTAKKES
jgi:hypothetical protein